MTFKRGDKMKRFLMRLVFAVAFVVLPTVVNAAPTGTPNLSVADAFEVRIVFGADTDDSEALPTGASCSVGVVYGGSGTVRLYQVATATTAAASGTQVGADFTASTTTPTKFNPGLPFLKAVASTASDTTVMTIRCSNLEVADGGVCVTTAVTDALDDFILVGGDNPVSISFEPDALGTEVVAVLSLQMCTRATSTACVDYNFDTDADGLGDTNLLDASTIEKTGVKDIRGFNFLRVQSSTNPSGTDDPEFTVCRGR